MPKLNLKNNSLLNLFLSEIKNFSELNKEIIKNAGASLNDIEKLEKRFNVVLPRIYTDLLQIYNGGELLILNQIKLLGINELVSNNKYFETFIHTAFFTIADAGNGNIICINMDKFDGNDSEIAELNDRTCIVSKRWTRFNEWIMDVLDHIRFNIYTQSKNCISNANDIIMKYEHNKKIHSVLINKSTFDYFFYKQLSCNKNITMEDYKYENFWMFKSGLPFGIYIHKNLTSAYKLHWHTFLELLYVS